MNTQTAERDAYSIRELSERYGVHRITIYREIWVKK
jgi:transposase